MNHKGQNWRQEMLDNNDKKWITDTIDEKLGEATTELRVEMREMKEELRGEMREMKEELRGEMREMKEELRGEMQEMKEELRGEMQEMRSDIVTHVTEQISEEFLDSLRRQSIVVLENTYQDYMKIVGENLPDKIRSYDRIDEKQQKHQDEIEMLRSIAYSHENRIARLEKAAY